MIYIWCIFFSAENSSANTPAPMDTDDATLSTAGKSEENKVYNCRNLMYDYYTNFCFEIFRCW